MDRNQTKYCMPRVKGSQLSCTLVGVLNVLFNLRNTAVLLHGPTGCAHYGMKFCEQMILREREILPGFHPPPLNFRSTALSENELIFGGEDRLCAEIAQMLESFPDVPLFVVPSCTVEVIGDDVRASARGCRGKRTAR
jgi:nitrogenase molybdenum-iron protein alpha/beta subunit